MPKTTEQPLGFLKLQFAAKNQKNLNWDPLAAEKFRKKVAQCQKIQRRTLWSRLILYLVLKIEYTEGGPSALT